jgi:hypothetical protein
MIEFANVRGEAPVPVRLEQQLLLDHLVGKHE